MSETNDVSKQPMVPSVPPDRRWELVFLAAAAIAAVVGAAFAIAAWRTADETLDATRSAAWDYSGAQNCAEYRGQVILLAGNNVPEDEIRAWFATEEGGARNPEGPTSDHVTALGDMEAECGKVSDLVAIWEPDRRPSPQLLSQIESP
jgi:hypothetical protein